MSLSASESSNGQKTIAQADIGITDLGQAHVVIQKLQEENARLWKSYELLKEELALVKRRLFVAKAERIDTTQYQMEFDELTQKLNALAGLKEPEKPEESAQTSGTEDASSTAGASGKDKGAAPNKRPKPTGRRNLEESDLIVREVEVADPLFEKLVEESKAQRMGFEESSKLGYERGGMRRVVIKRVKYVVVGAKGETEIETAPLPKELVPRCLAAASTLAFILVSKYCDGLPLFRIEQMFSRWGFGVDRGTMSRWVEHLGATLGATVIEAAKKHALNTAFCIMTDATGFAIQPTRDEKKQARGPCRKGHYFVQIADRDHIFFEFTPKETSENVRIMFKGYQGYLQADAKSVYDVLFRLAEPDDPHDDGCTRTEVGCWAHARRKFWEAALAKHAFACEALLRIHKIFELDAGFRKDNPPSKVKELRQQHLKPLVTEFFQFATIAYEMHKSQRGSLRSALGYCVRQQQALSRFLEDGRLRMDNNLSEGELRKVVRIRDAALFAGSDEHAQSAGHILSLIASARLHNLNPEVYLRELIIVLPYWPKDRYLELAPKFWATARATLDLAQLTRDAGYIDVPDIAPDSPCAPQKQPAATASNAPV